MQFLRPFKLITNDNTSILQQSHPSRSFPIHHSQVTLTFDYMNPITKSHNINGLTATQCHRPDYHNTDIHHHKTSELSIANNLI